MKRVFVSAALFFITLVIFTGSGYLYLSNTNGVYKAEQELSNVPYSSAPEDTAILFGVNNRYIYFHLGFSQNILTVIPDYTEDLLFSEKDIFYMNADENTVAGIIDRLGGIELAVDGGTFRYTGIQVTQLLYGSKQTEEIRHKILISVIEKIGKEGLERQDLVYLIEKTDTDLTVPDCFYWSDSIGALFQNYTIN